MMRRPFQKKTQEAGAQAVQRYQAPGPGFKQTADA